MRQGAKSPIGLVTRKSMSNRMMLKLFVVVKFDVLLLSLRKMLFVYESVFYFCICHG